MGRAFTVLARMKRLRGTRLDPFGRHEDRRTERALIAHYEEQMSDLLGRVTPANVEVAAQIAALPDLVRGYGYVKKRSLERATAREQVLLRRFAAATVPSSHSV
jgi:indolepyruvate ferredoxin oxidoreductase